MTPGIAAELVGDSVAARSSHAGERSSRRQAEQLTAPLFVAEEAGRIGEQRRLDHFVVGHERLDHQPPAATTWSEQAGRLGEQRQGLLAGSVARRQQLAIEVEEGDDIRRVDTVEHRFGAHEDLGGGERCRVAARDGDDAAAGCRLQLLAEPGHPRAQVGEARSAAHLAHRWALGGTTGAHQPVVVAEPDSSLTTSAAQEGAARPAGEDPRSPRGVVHADDPVLRPAQLADQRRRQQRRSPRLLVAAVDDVDDRPPGPCVVDGQGDERTPDRSASGDCRARCGQQHGGAGAPGALDHDVAGVPRRGALLLHRLVVLVDDDGDRQPGARRPCRAAGTDHHVDATGSGRPLAGGRRRHGVRGG